MISFRRPPADPAAAKVCTVQTCFPKDGQGNSYKKCVCGAHTFPKICNGRPIYANTASNQHSLSGIKVQIPGVIQELLSLVLREVGFSTVCA